LNESGRIWTVVGIVLTITSIFIGQLVHLQLIDNDLKVRASDLTENRTIIKPSRGMILDRHGEVLVASEAVYDLVVLPRGLADLDTAACAVWAGISREAMDASLKKARRFSRYKYTAVRRRIAPEEHARMAASLYAYPGFELWRKPLRSHRHAVATHLIGEYAEASRDDLDRDAFYRLGDFKGKTGLESIYEEALRGEKGRRSVVVDARNRVRQVGVAASKNRPAVDGLDLTTTLDLDLQQHAELLLAGKTGSVVAIEPSTGEVLAIVSAPFFDPNLMLGATRGKAYDSLLQDPQKPLFNRAIRATYRPGSIFKLVQGAIAMDEGVIHAGTRLPCNRDLIGCHGPHTLDDLSSAVVHSCNPYFYQVMERWINHRNTGSHFATAADGLDRWRAQVMAFGFGTKLGNRLRGTATGNIPAAAYYDKIYGKRHWDFRTIYSIAIGEGELLTTPLQMANLAAILANRGWYREPHYVKDLGGIGPPAGVGTRTETGIEPAQFKPILDGMQNVVEEQGGTGWRARIPGIEICGKTGTVQNDPLEDHSVFIAFAPRKNPKIAVSVYVESAGSGGDWAAPIAALLIEQYLTGQVDSAKQAGYLGAIPPAPAPTQAPAP
jgi:penicillin-binding protein 2